VPRIEAKVRYSARVLAPHRQPQPVADGPVNHRVPAGDRHRRSGVEQLPDHQLFQKRTLRSDGLTGGLDRRHATHDHSTLPRPSRVTQGRPTSATSDRIHRE
jgi:hypothetical protein